MTGTFPVEAGWVVFSRDGRAQFGWRDPETGSFHSDANGECIADAIGGVEFFSDVMH